MEVAYLRTLHFFKGLPGQKFLLSFLVPFSLVYFVCLSTFLGRADFSTFFVMLAQGLMYGLFLAICAGWFGVAVVAIFPWVIRLFKLKSNMYLTSIGVILVSFALGIHYSCLPERQKKYLMPNNYSVYLNAKKYKIWYYPRWGKPFSDIRKMRKFEEHLPRVRIISSSGQFIPVALSTSQVRTGPSLSGMEFGEVDIPIEGTYELSASSEFDSMYVLALVPPDVQVNKRMPWDPPFWGYSDEKLEQP